MRHYSDKASDRLFEIKSGIERIKDTLENYETEDVKTFSLVENLKKSVNDMEAQTVAKLIAALEAEY